MPRIAISRALVSALAALLTAAVSLAAPAAADDAGAALCAQVAGSYQKLVAGPDAPKDFYPDSPLTVLANHAGSSISLAPHIAEVGKRLTPLQWAQKQKLTLKPQLTDALDKTDFLDQLPGSSYYAASRIEGTLSCYASIFFTVTNGIATETTPPANWSEEDGDSCGTYRVFGKIGAASVAFEESYDYSGLLLSTLSVSQWTGDHFAPSCDITFHFGVRIAANQQFNAWDESCTAKNCGALRQAVVPLIESLQANPANTEANLLGKLTDQQRAAYQAMKTDANLKPPDKMDDPLYFDEKTPATLPLMLDGQLYLAEIGHQTIGWRTYSDWDVKLFERNGKDLGRVAEIAIGMAKNKLESVEVK